MKSIIEPTTLQNPFDWDEYCLAFEPIIYANWRLDYKGRVHCDEVPAEEVEDQHSIRP